MVFQSQSYVFNVSFLVLPSFVKKKRQLIIQFHFLQVWTCKIQFFLKYFGVWIFKNDCHCGDNLLKLHLGILQHIFFYIIMWILVSKIQSAKTDIPINTLRPGHVDYVLQTHFCLLWLLLSVWIRNFSASQIQILKEQNIDNNPQKITPKFATWQVCN